MVEKCGSPKHFWNQSKTGVMVAIETKFKKGVSEENIFVNLTYHDRRRVMVLNYLSQNLKQKC